ncbi:MAG: hypothetical protein RL242_3111 [Pseudomonadota bacterium]|jgi:hypothetical protein
MRPKWPSQKLWLAVRKIDLRFIIIRKLILLATTMVVLEISLHAQTNDQPTQVDPFVATSLEAQRLIFETSRIDGDRAKGIAMKRPIRKMVGRFGNTIVYKSPNGRPSSARKLVISRSQSYMSAIP